MPESTSCDIKTPSRAVEYLAGRLNVAIELLPAVCLDPEAFADATHWPHRFSAEMRAATQMLRSMSTAEQRQVVGDSLAVITAGVAEIRDAWTALLGHASLSSEQIGKEIQVLRASYDACWGALNRLGEILAVKTEHLDRQVKKTAFQRRTIERLHVAFAK